MNQRSRKLIPLTLLALLAGAWPAGGQPCEHENLKAYAQDFFTDTFRDKPSGTSVSWVDVISRLIAQVDSLDLDSGETSTDLTWNIDDQWTFKASVVNEPSLFMPLKEAIGDDSDLLTSLSDQVSQGDDVQFSLDYNFQSKNSGKLGVWAFSERAAARAQQTLDNSAAAGNETSAAAYSALSSASCGQKTRIYAAMAPALAMSLDDDKPKTLTANVFYRSRDELAGQDEAGISFKYTYGLDDPGEDRSEEEREDLMRNAMLASVRSLALAEPAFAARLDTALQGRGLGRLDDVDSTMSGAASALMAEQTSRTGITDRRLAVEGKWNRKDDYEHMLPTVALTLPKDESLTVMLAYSFRFRGDKAATDEDNDDGLPLFELNASYEHVDSAEVRQSRLIAKAIVTKELSFMGENTELTAGLVYANKPEFLAEQDVDRELSANLGLTFKFGSRQPAN